MTPAIELTARQADLLATVERLLPSLTEAALEEAKKNAEINRLVKSYVDIELDNTAVTYIKKLKHRAGETLPDNSVEMAAVTETSNA